MSRVECRVDEIFQRGRGREWAPELKNGGPMLSRVADSLYWMSRYLERAEHTTRLLDVNLNLMLDESSTSCGPAVAAGAAGAGQAEGCEVGRAIRMS